MAHDYPFGVRVEFAQAGRHIAHRNMERAGEGRVRNLLWFAHVEDAEPIAVHHTALKFDRFNFADFGHS